jgi:hypothetical protein
VRTNANEKRARELPSADYSRANECERKTRARITERRLLLLYFSEGDRPIHQLSVTEWDPGEFVEPRTGNAMIPQPGETVVGFR